MAKFDFNLLGYAFQDVLKTMRSSFDLAAGALATEIVRAQAALSAYVAAVRMDPSAWVGEREEGMILWDQSQVLDMNIANAEEALMHLRKAFVIAAYHHWERSARRWGKAGPKARHSQLSAASLAEGYPVDPRLEAVVSLVNTLKHNSDVKGAALLAAWPEAFPPNFRPRTGRTDWYDAISLSDRQVAEICDAIGASGPTARLTA